MDYTRVLCGGPYLIRLVIHPISRHVVNPAHGGYSSSVSRAFAWLVGSADADAGIENDGLEACSCHNAYARATRQSLGYPSAFLCFEGIRKYATYAQACMLSNVQLMLSPRFRMFSLCFFSSASWACHGCWCFSAFRAGLRCLKLACDVSAPFAAGLRGDPGALLVCLWL